MRTNLNFSPLFRSTIGFDRVFDLLENASRVQSFESWPPYDIVRTSEDSTASRWRSRGSGSPT